MKADKVEPILKSFRDGKGGTQKQYVADDICTKIKTAFS